ncbi:hypothetical protein F6X40_03055 [Paraburkholderia sp. UCT31]|nr:hypothetical protein [Paraburkholderia sp. UCT31]
MSRAMRRAIPAGARRSRANRPIMLGFTYAYCDSLDVSVGKAVGDAPVESASHSPRINARFCYQLN